MRRALLVTAVMLFSLVSVASPAHAQEPTRGTVTLGMGVEAFIAPSAPLFGFRAGWFPTVGRLFIGPETSLMLADPSTLSIGARIGYEHSFAPYAYARMAREILKSEDEDHTNRTRYGFGGGVEIETGRRFAVLLELGRLVRVEPDEDDAIWEASFFVTWRP